MTFNEVYDTLPANGWLTKPEAELLWESARSTEGPILEVGTYFGRATTLLGALGRIVHTVDPFDGFDDGNTGDVIRDAFDDNMVHRGLENVFQHRMRIEEWVQRHHRTMEFAYLDGDHTHRGTVNQIRAAFYVNAKVVCIHDVNDGGGGEEVKRAALELLGPWNDRVERLASWKLE